MSFNKKFFTTGGIVASSGDAACSTDSVQAFGADNAFSSNIALYQLDGNDDDTTGNYNGTIDTGVTYSATGAKFGQAANFNGSSAIVLPNTILSSDCSISTWFNLNSSGTTDTLFEFDHENRILFRPQSGSYSAYIGNSGYFDHGLSFSTGQWYHLVITFSAGNPFKIYVDGVLSSYTSGNTSVYSLNHDNILGAANPSGGAGLNGKIDQVRIFDKAISAEDVATLYAETESTASNTNPLSEGAGVALYSLDYDASEASGYYDGTPTNVEFGVGGKINYGARFNATSSNINIGGNVVNSLTKLSVSMWVYWDGTTNSNDDYFIALGKASSGKIFSADITNSTGIIGFYDGASVLNSTGAVSANTWTHIVLTADATVLKMYLNGSLDSTHTISSLNFDSSGNAGFIGSWITGTDYEFDGSIDQVRLFSKALNSTEVSTLYAETACVHTATTTDNDYPTTNLAYYKLDNSAEDEKGSYDGTETNIEYKFGRFGQAAVFNGSSSEITVSSFPSLSQVGVSMWVNMPNISQQAGLIARYGSYREFAIYMYGGTLTASLYYNGNNGNAISVTASTYMSNNTWHHIAYTADGVNQPRLYIDGAEVGTAQSNNNAYYTSSEPLDIGHFAGISAYNYEGKIDQVRIFSTALDDDQVTELYNEKPEVDTSNFKAVLYEGNGGSQYISNVGFEPDLVWIKERTGSAWHILTDSVRGANKTIYSNSNYQQESLTNVMNSFESNGFMVAHNSAYSSVFSNRNNESYVGWVWKGGGEAVNIGVNSITGSTPSIASDVSANVDSGFSIVKYTGNNTSGATVAHGLNNAPEIIFIKTLQTGPGFASWAVQASVLGGDKFLLLNETDAKDTSSGYFNNTLADSDVITLGNFDVTNDNTDIIAYCWHSVAGYSKIGSYSGSGSSGNAQSVGFAPSFVVVKSTIGSTSNWSVFDNPRTGERLNWNTSGAGSPDTRVTLTSTGFEFTGSAFNNSGVDWLYMAFK